MSLFQPKQWSIEHFAHADLGDIRRTNRLTLVAEQMATFSGKSIARTCNGVDAQLEGSYRLIRNKHVIPSIIRRAGFQCSAKKARNFDEILAIEDTTSLSYKHSVAQSLGKLGKTTDKSRGWWVHSTLLLDALTTQTIGLIHQDWWLRPNTADETDEKESGKWADASFFMRKYLGEMMPNVISVCDREADIKDYMAEKIRYEERFVVRAKHNRKLDNTDKKLFEFINEQAIIGSYTIDIPQKGIKHTKTGKCINRPKRKAKLNVKTVKIMINTMEINLVHAEEVGSEDDKLSWTLLTTESVEDLNDALKVIDIYSTRWRVEDFHKAWKTGAGVERLRMIEPDHHERAASMLAFIAVRLLQLKEALTLVVYLKKKGLITQAGTYENTRCDTILETDEWQLLMHLYPYRGMKKGKAPPLKWAYQSIAKMGGFNDTKRTGIASWLTVWEGWSTLQNMLIAYRVGKEVMNA